jgi:beta-glucosidase
MTWVRFPREFEWGAATAAYQIEGAAFEDGKGLSIWDVFCQQPGRIQTGENGDVACDHYHRYREDVALMRGLGLTSYRFSVSWPRVLPFGVGPANSKGLDFYDRLVDALLEAGIKPCVTLYHWDLPQAVQDRGGWIERDTAAHFAEYAKLMFDRLGGRVTRWITHNEPLVTAMAGHRLGFLAPGIQDLAATARVVHHLLLSHGLAVQAFRASGRDGTIGITNANTSYEAADERAETAIAAERARDFGTRLFHGPVYGKGYPTSVVRTYEAKGAPFPVKAGDFEVIATPTDFLGVNLYTRERVTADSRRSIGYRPAEPSLPLTPMGYERAPHALGDFVRWVSAEYGKPPIFVTENGVCDNTEPGSDGEIADKDRIALLSGFLSGLAQAVLEGAVDVRGYYLWSLLDNFEWAFGTSKRFGIVWVDYATQRRTPKASARWYQEVIRQNGFQLSS